jgi:mannosyl-oligosaccharide alpha-1,2-mannosidase
LRAAFGAISNLVFLTPKRQLLYVTDIRDSLITGVFEHLSCFFPGLLALGAHILPASAFSSLHERALHQAVARGIAHTCYLTYADMLTGLGADEVMMESFIEGRFDLGRWLGRVDISQKSSDIPGVSRLAPPLGQGEREAREYSLKSPVYLLRPEVRRSHIYRSAAHSLSFSQAVEAMYLMWKATGEDSWRERGWQIFVAIERTTRRRTAYASVHGVDGHEFGYLDTMPRQVALL